MEKFFAIDENQDIWNAYFSNIMSQWDAENKERLEKQSYTDEEKAEKIKKIFRYSEKEKDDLTPYKFEYRKKKTSVQQYKPVVLEFEKNVNKSFNEITADDVEEFIEKTAKKNKINHLKGFLQECVSTGLIDNKDSDFLIMLLPEDYKYIGKLLAGCEKKKNDFKILPAGHNKKIICPFCRKEKEATVDNWMLIRFEGEDEKYLTCRECEGEDGKENNKNI